MSQSWRVVLIVVWPCLGMMACQQPTVVPPTTMISPPSRPLPAPGVPEPVEPLTPYSPPTSAPIDPIMSSNPWKPDGELRDWNYIVLHHTASTSGSVESIHEEHLKRKDKAGNHWLGIGYHFVIGNGDGMDDGAIEPTFRWRQQLQGAHAGVADYNQHGIGIVLIGHFDKSSPTEAQPLAVKKLVGPLKREYGIGSGSVIGHGDVKATECPGKHFPMAEVRDSIAMRIEQAAIRTNLPPTITLTNMPGDSRK